MARGKQNDQSLTTKEKIRTAVMSMMQTRTLEEISVEEICKKAGVGIGTFYHYYKSKTDIALEVHSEMDAGFLTLASDPEVQQMSPYQYIIRHFACYANFVTQQKIEFSKMVYAVQDKMFVDHNRPVYTTLKHKLAEEQAKGRVAASVDVDELCDYINLMLRGLAYDWCLWDGKYDLVKASVDFAKKILAAYEGLLGGDQ